MKDTEETILQIGGCHRTLVESLGSLGPVYVQARNRGGGLGKHIESFDPLVVPDQTYAVDPGLGLAFSLDEFAAAHFMGGDTEGCSERIDFEFGCFPAGMTVVATPGLSEPGRIEKMIESFDCSSLTCDQLTCWRSELGAELPICDCCVEASRIRGDRPEDHPVFHILSELTAQNSSVNVHLVGEHVDFVTAMKLGELKNEGPYIVASGVPGLSILHIDVRMIHAVQLGLDRVDDEVCSVASIYDMHGDKNFLLSTPGTKALRSWRKIFDASGYRHQPLNPDY